MRSLTLLALLVTSAHAEDLLQLDFPLPTEGTVKAATSKPKVVVIDLWATWCEPCVAALPKLDALARDLGPKGVMVLAVSQDEDAALVRRFLEEVKLAHLQTVMDVSHRAATALKPETLPATYVLDDKGTVKATFVGYEAGTEQKIRKAVEALLPAPVGGPPEPPKAP